MAPGPAATPSTALCVDFGSTFTKALLVDLGDGRVLGTASRPTTLETDLLDGYDACRADLLAQDPRAADAVPLACSSAGGGLRIAVLGNEELVTAEAGRRVALSSGGRVVEVLAAAGRVPEDALERVVGHTTGVPGADVVLLTGGTDGGNRAVLVRAARDLVAAGWRGPVVVAGNAEAHAEVAEVLGSVPHVLAGNVLPRIGVLEPGPARAAVREVFLAHVIGGKHLSSRPGLAAMLRGATPDVVLTGVELLARGLDADHPGAGDVVVVDVGGATTDVHSVIAVDPEDAGLAREVVGSTPVTRTVEGDLGLRWSAPAAAAATGLSIPAAALERRHRQPGWLPGSPEEADLDEALARAAVGLALVRHAGRATRAGTGTGTGSGTGPADRGGTDLREVDLLVGSGGLLRHGRPGVAARVLAGHGEESPRWRLPRAPRVVVDREYVLAAAGLLAAEHPVAAYRLVQRMLRGDGG